MEEPTLRSSEVNRQNLFYDKKNRGIKNRHAIEILHDLLQILNQGEIAPTQLMYATRISWKPMIKYTEKIIKLGWGYQIELHDNKDKRRKRTFGITPLGRDILAQLEGVQTIITTFCEKSEVET